MIKLEFWKEVHKKWVSNTDGVPSHIKHDAKIGSGQTKEEIEKEAEDLYKISEDYDI